MTISPEEHQNLDAFTLPGCSISVGDHVESLQGWNRIARTPGAFLMTQVSSMTPSTATTPVLTAEQAAPHISRIGSSLVSRPGPGALLHRSGQVRRPAMSIAPGLALKQPLPCDIQFIGSCGSEGLLPCLAGELERIHPWPLTASPRDGEIDEAA